MVASQLDSSINLTEDKWGVTLIRKGFHAEILVEGLENGNYFCKKVHLLGFGSSAKIYSGIGYACGVLPSYSSIGTVDVKNITRYKDNLEYDAKSPTWNLSRHAANKIITESEGEKINENASFSLFGRHAFFNVIKQMMGFPSTDSCISWAINKLLHAGVKIKTDGNGFNLCTMTNRYTRPDLQTEHYDINDLCKFVKEGDTDAIKMHFSKEFNVNQLTKDACVGSVEAYLGRYTPLALAVAYGQYQTVKLLIEEYQADVNQLVGRENDFTVIDCASHNFWFVSKNNKSFALSEFSTEDVENLKSRIGGKFPKIRQLDSQQFIYKRISFTHKEISDIEKELTKLADDASKTLSAKLVDNYKNKEAIAKYLEEKYIKSGAIQRPIIKELCRAAYAGDNSKIKSILNSNPGSSINQIVSNAIWAFWASYLGVYSPLMAAVIANKIETVKLLVEQFKADVNQLNGRELDHTVLDYAIYYGYEDIKNYLENGAKAKTAKQVKEGLNSGFFSFKHTFSDNSYQDENVSDAIPSSIMQNRMP